MSENIFVFEQIQFCANLLGIKFYTKKISPSFDHFSKIHKQLFKKTWIPITLSGFHQFSPSMEDIQRHIQSNLLFHGRVQEAYSAVMECCTKYRKFCFTLEIALMMMLMKVLMIMMPMKVLMSIMMALKMMMMEIEMIASNKVKRDKLLSLTLTFATFTTTILVMKTMVIMMLMI